MKQELLEANKNKLQLFQNEEFGSIRTIIIDGNPWFVGKDVAKALGYSNPQKALRDHVDDEDKTVNDSFIVNGTMGILINESGLYSLIISSKLPSVKKFKRWVTSEVLPSIRKTGRYSVAQSGKENKLDSLVSEIANLKVVYAQINNIETILEDQQDVLKKQQRNIEKIHNTMSEKLEVAIDGMTLSTRQQEKIHEEARKRVNDLLGGAHSNEYKKSSRMYFINLWNGLKEIFHCGSSWKDLNPCDFDKAVSWIGCWEYTG